MAAALLPCVEVDAQGEPSGSVIWLHGLGASGHDFEPIVPYLQLPQVRFVFPHAPSRGVTINQGLIMPAWYDIVSFGLPRGGEDEEDVRESAAMVEALVAREGERGVSADRVVLAGFSQGGAMALFTGTRYPKTLAGIMVLSGYEVLAHTREAEAAEANRRTPMLFCHGTHDPMVTVDRARAAFAAHEGPGRLAEWHEFPMAHEVAPAEIAVIRDWLAVRLGAAKAPGSGS
ncbi:MAG TPA: alpha/beta fold hydrolase [Vicinamibacteria bacterium]|nr:alpha/beta fold hydrolase [Vicinamibacteria bacterium]